MDLIIIQLKLKNEQEFLKYLPVNHQLTNRNTIIQILKTHIELSDEIERLYKRWKKLSFSSSSTEQQTLLEKDLVYQNILNRISEYGCC
jgi:hypothetical protein